MSEVSDTVEDRLFGSDICAGIRMLGAEHLPVSNWFIDIFSQSNDVPTAAWLHAIDVWMQNLTRGAFTLGDMASISAVRGVNLTSTFRYRVAIEAL